MQSLPSPAQYLMRIDDLCPTVHFERWSSIRALIDEFKIRPILAVVPDNADQALEKSTVNPEFWEEIRSMERDGAMVGMHGYRHCCTEHARSLVPLHSRSEFAGKPLIEQREQIRSGLALLRNEGLTPRIFVAPKHSFDRITLRALSQEGLPYLCDGFARVPFNRGGVVWIPQQLWGPASRRKGLWTICVHPNSTGTRRLAELRGFVSRHREQFTSVDEVITKIPLGKLSMSERAYARIALWRVMLRMRRNRARN